MKIYISEETTPPHPVLFTETTMGFGPVVMAPTTVIGKTTVISGDIVNLTCVTSAGLGFSWFYLNHTQYDLVESGVNLNFKATMNASGIYMCSDSPSKNPMSLAVNLTVVGKCAPP